MADTDDCRKIMDLANLIREKGDLMDPENDADESDRWQYPSNFTGPGEVIVFHAFDEMTNRLYVATRANPYVSHYLDLKENTIIGFQFQKGSPRELEAVHKALQKSIEEHKKEMNQIDEDQAAQGLSVKDGMGSHKL